MDNDDHTALGALAEQLRHHERRSEERYEMLCDKLKTKQESNMEGINSDKVNINLGSGDGGSGGAGLAAVIAALGNRNEGGDTAGLIAALGNRNNDGGMAAMLPGLMASQNGGMNNLWPIILLALLGRGRGGLLGGDGEGCSPGGIGAGHAALLQTLLEGQSDLRADVPRTALETQNAIQQAVSALALGTQQGFANTKDAVQASLLANLAATSGVKDSVMNNAALLQRDICDVKSTVQTEACATRELVQAGTTAILSRIDRSEIDELRARADRAERAIEVNTLRSQVEVNQTVTTTQAQAQGQFQVQTQLQDVAAQLRTLGSIVAIGNQTMLARQAQDIVNLGTMTASGTQAAANTQVR
jgi:hypothetical protein